MHTQSVRHISVTIERPLRDVYAFLEKPENFPLWASGLGHSFQHVSDNEWLADTPMGRVKLRFSDHNAYGVLDHFVIPERGEIIFSPMRVIANGQGSEVTFTLLRRAKMTDEDFERDAAWVQRDLRTLKDLLETAHG